MAKKRRVKAAAPKTDIADHVSGAPTGEVDRKSLSLPAIALALLAGSFVYVAYHPCDSIEVEQGGSLWFVGLSIVVAILAMMPQPKPASAEPSLSSGDVSDTSGNRLQLADRVVDVAAWSIAAWMMVSAFTTSPPGNLRMATNEAWVWVAAAAIFTAGRRLLVSSEARRNMLLLVVICGLGLAVHGQYQDWISLPGNRAAFERDPDRVLESIGLDAPEGSAERMRFASRLNDGGPTATFALANSLAAALLAGIVIATGFLRFTWSSIRNWERGVWIAVLVLCTASLVAVRSRSAMIAMLIGIVVVMIAQRSGPRMRLAWFASLFVAGVGGMLAVMLALFGNPEWFEMASSSFSFRLQYWRATWRMVLDHPVFGAGPGNFQSMYDRYREPITNEQIAEPHNFLFETLASGGWIALFLLLCLIAAGWYLARRPPKRPQHEQSHEEKHGQWVWLGAGVSLSMVWLIGIASRHTPDFDAHKFAIPIAMVAAFVLNRSASKLTCLQVDQIGRAAVIAILVHLCASGGWTVPGVALTVWALAAMLTRKNEMQRERGSRAAAVAAVAGCLWLATLYGMSLRPDQQRKRWMADAARAQEAGQLVRARESLEKALIADPWSAEPAIWLADFYRWNLVLRGDSAESRERWRSSMEEARKRAGENPSVYRQLGTQRIHLYQVYGLSSDLEGAKEAFEQAVRLSPAQQWLYAQLSEIQREQANAEAATGLATRAKELSELGGYTDRLLFLQQIYVAEKIGRSAANNAVRKPADQLLGLSKQ